MDLGTLSASVVSSVVSRLVCYPLDTIAVQHVSSTRRPIFSVPLRSYYRGVGASVCIVTPAIALYLCTYRQSKESLLPYLGDTTANYVLLSSLAACCGHLSKSSRGDYRSALRQMMRSCYTIYNRLYAMKVSRASTEGMQ